MSAVETPVDDEKVWGIEIVYGTGPGPLPKGHEDVPDSIAKHVAVIAKTLPDHVEEFKVIVTIAGTALDELRA